jgi:hypothetical protein
LSPAAKLVADSSKAITGAGGSSVSCLRVDVAPGSSIRSLRAFAAPEAGFDYFETEAHHRSLAGRIIAAVGGFSVVVVTGDPPPSAPTLAASLSDVKGSGYRVVSFSCGAEPGCRDVPHLCRALSVLLARGRVKSEDLAPAPPLAVFDETDRLSDEQIEEIFRKLYPRTQFEEHAAAVFLAHPEFLVRLERLVLRSWAAKRLLVARLRFQELGADEIPAFIRHQLGSGEAEDALTPQAMTAIANVSGGDPMVVNRFSRRVLDFAAAATGERLAHAALAPAALAPMEMLPRGRAITNLDAPSTRTSWGWGSSTVLMVSATTVFCLACVGVAAVLLLHPADERIAAFRIPVTEAASTAAEGRSSPGDAARAAPTAGSLPEEPAESPAEPALSDAPALAGATQREPASPVAAPAATALLDDVRGTLPAPSPADTVPTAAAGPMSASPEAAPTFSTPVPITPPAPPRLSAADIAALLSRGNRFFALHDIASARLFYERAAEAGGGEAALRLAKTFDPAFLALDHLNTVRGNAAMAAYWYSFARDLGDAEGR